MLRRQAIATLICLVACREHLTPPEHRRVVGTLYEATGDIVREGMPVTLTELASKSELTVLHTDQRGQFSAALSPGQYAFAATSATGYVFSTRLVRASDDLAITLSSTCNRIKGAISASMVLPAAVSLSRISQDIGDRFIAPIQRDATWGACLPEGTYLTKIEGAMVSLARPVRIPGETDTSLSAYAVAAIEAVPREVRFAASDLKSFARSLENVRLVGLGEANHGTAEFYEYRSLLSLELAKSGLNLILIEVDAIAMFEVDDYVLGENVDIAKAVENLGFWITDTQDFLRFLDDVKRHNMQSPVDRKIHVLGVDAQSIKLPIRFLLTHKASLGISQPEIELLTEITEDEGAAFKGMSTDRRSRLLVMLDRITDSTIEIDIKAHSERAAIAARSIRSQLRYVDGGQVGQLRDLAMADLATHLVKLPKVRQATLWAHNGHIARQFDGAYMSLGQHLAQRLGSGYFPIAFLSYRGDGRAWDEAGKIGVIPHQLPPAPLFNVESVVMNATGFPSVAWIRFDTGNSSAQRWLTTPHYVREFGSAYHPANTQTLRSFPDAFSAVSVIQRGRSTAPTPTGARMITK
jgi:erythromycin esterase